MNASHAFRSHLMQQFAAQARTQARPPLALLGLLSDDNNPTAELLDQGSTTNHGERLWHLSSIEDSSIHHQHPQQSNSVNLRRRHTDSDIFSSRRRGSHSFSPLHTKEFSTSSAAEAEDFHDEESTTHAVVEKSGDVSLSLAFQTMLQTRRSTSRFTPLAASAPLPVVEEYEYWQAATERAVLCGYQAPNHKRTEPFTFKRMIAPSERTERLADIAYHVSLRQAATKTDTQESSCTPTTTAATVADRNKILLAQKKQAAQRKRDKWSKIPAFLVATVHEQEHRGDNDDDDSDSTLNLEADDDDVHHDLDSLHDYEPLAYVPPQTERALEDYASACAAVQNVLLSLHSEDIATKWVTGNVIRTPAFRQLVQAEPTDRIVALIMVGQAGDVAANNNRRRPLRRHRRPLRSGSANDVLVDLM